MPVKRLRCLLHERDVESSQGCADRVERKECAMSQPRNLRSWTKRDRILHMVPAVPLVLYYFGTTYLLAARSLIVAGVFLLLWAGVNVAVAGICAGCPYRGGYCPGLCQLYFAPFISKLMYRNAAGPRSFKPNLLWMGVLGIGNYAFGFIWLYVYYWREQYLIILALLALLLLHMPLSFFLLCR